MASDVGTPVGGAPSVTLGTVMPARADVDAAMAQARDAGAEVLRLPIELPWGGYSGYFADPDGHVWEAVWIPEEFGWVDGSFDATLGASERDSDR